MKRLLILIILAISLNGFSQDTTKSKIDGFLPDSLVYKELSRKYKLNKVITVNDFVKYLEYCYNDSSKVNFGSDGKGGYLARSWRDYVFINGEMVKKEVWIHREPTFNDFINWLKKCD
jgi:hypothetical protein